MIKSASLLPDGTERRAQDYYLSRRASTSTYRSKDHSFLIVAGSVFSTARDVYKFGEAVLDGKFGAQVKQI